MSTEIKIYKSNVTADPSQKLLEDLVRNLPDYMHDRALRYKNTQAAINFCIGRLLLIRGLKDLNKSNLISNIQYTEEGKPILEKINFNISHSNKHVMCAFSSYGEIGIDIEQSNKIILNDFESFFTNPEWLEITKSQNPIKKFYWYWCRKEAIIKALSCNLSYLHKIELNASKNTMIIKDEDWNLKDLDLANDLQIAICTKHSIEKIEVVNVVFSDLGAS